MERKHHGDTVKTVFCNINSIFKLFPWEEKIKTLVSFWNSQIEVQAFSGSNLEIWCHSCEIGQGNEREILPCDSRVLLQKPKPPAAAGAASVVLPVRIGMYW